MPSPRIDVHAHFLPDFYSDALRAAGLSHPDGMPTIPEWSEEIALGMMDNLGIAAAVLSISTPGVYFGDEQAAHKLAMKTNEEAARLQREYPSRFGWFALTSLPNVKTAIAEASAALDEEGADGVVIESNQQGMYLGDPKLEPFYRALDDRKAVLFVHPTSPKCQGCNSLTPGVYLARGSSRLPENGHKRRECRPLRCRSFVNMGARQLRASVCQGLQI